MESTGQHVAEEGAIQGELSVGDVPFESVVERHVQTSPPDAHGERQPQGLEKNIGARG